LRSQSIRWACALFAGAIAFLCPVRGILGQQTKPTPAEAELLLKTRPDLILKLQQQMKAMGLTPEQVRARLKEQGYPENLLDNYMSGAKISDSTLVPNDQVFAAMRALGVGDSLAVDSLRKTAARFRERRAVADSAFLDTLSRLVKNDTIKEAVRRLLRSREAQMAQVDSGYTVFGLNLFTNENTLFNPNLAGAVDPNYRIGPGDKMALFLTGDFEQAYQLEVAREGFVVIPSVGQLGVVGLTKAQLEDLLRARLGRAYSGIGRGTLRFSLAISQVGSNQVVVTGDVTQPGSWLVSRTGTLMSALYAAKGPTPSGSFRRIELRRGDRLITTFDLYDYLVRGDPTRDPRLESGDVVFVPPRGPQVRIAGAVLRPATYELKPGETLASLITMAGGFAATADRRTIQIDRIVPPEQRGSSGSDRRLVAVSSDLFATGNGPAEPLQNGDIVRVFEVPLRLSNRVGVDGNVWTPGAVGFRQGMHLSQALRGAGGLKPDSYLGEVQVTRLRPDSSRQMLRTAAFDTTGAVADDFVLMDGDQIRVFSLTDFRPKRYVTISGAVKNSGRIPYTDGMTLRDLVLLAGGPLESALLSYAEIARLPENRAGGVTAVPIRVALDSSYLFERFTGGRYLGPPGIPAPSARAPEIPLEPYDAVLIFRQPNWELERLVSIYGEVRYPGRYTLNTKAERISDLLTRAGGLTNNGYADGIVFIRSFNDVGRIGIDLPAVLRNPNYVDNITLVDGDSIFVPQYSAVVQVRGAVNSPVGVAYVKGADLDFYIRSAGGGTVKADVRRAFVTQPNGKVESRNRHLGLYSSTPEPQPGSTVTVPDKDPNDKRDYVAMAGAVAQVLASLVAVIAIIRK
jgi:polysaccharide export outer membrane protein